MVRRQEPTNDVRHSRVVSRRRHDEWMEFYPRTPPNSLHAWIVVGCPLAARPASMPRYSPSVRTLSRIRARYELSRVEFDPMAHQLLCGSVPEPSCLARTSRTASFAALLEPFYSSNSLSALAPHIVVFVYFLLQFGHACDLATERFLASCRRVLSRLSDDGLGGPWWLPHQEALCLIWLLEMHCLGDYYSSYWPDSHPLAKEPVVCFVVTIWKRLAPPAQRAPAARRSQSPARGRGKSPAREKIPARTYHAAIQYRDHWRVSASCGDGLLLAARHE